MHTLDNRALPRAAGPAPVHERASTFRATLSSRNEADALLAAAAQTRRDAGLQADLLLTEAEALSAELTGQARSVLADARQQATGIIAVARASAEAITREARERHHSEEVLVGMETVARDLGVTLRQAQDAVAEVGRELGLLHTGGAAAASVPPADVPAARRVAERAVWPEEPTEPRPLGWLFRSDRH